MFFEKAQFPWLNEFEAHWKDIRAELEALHEEDYAAWPEKRYYNQGWKTYGLYAWGVKLDKHLEQCPKTAALLEKVPGIFNSGFSYMQPGTHIRPHCGYAEGVLRAHLGLIVPDGCGLRSGDQVRSWKEGEAWVFDDTVEHEAWNRSNQIRCVLLVDFKAEDLVVNKPKKAKGLLVKLFG